MSKRSKSYSSRGRGEYITEKVMLHISFELRTGHEEIKVDQLCCGTDGFKGLGKLLKHLLQHPFDFVEQQC